MSGADVFPGAGPFLALSGAVANLPGLPVLLGGPVRRWRGLGRPPAGGTVLAWGRKPSAERATRLAARHGLPVLQLEDGFARSVGLGDEPPLSLVLDDLGIYYDAGTPSRLEALVTAAIGPEALARGRALVALWREGRISKYNQSREYAGPLPENYVLVVDQTAGDAAIRHGAADASAFARMLEAALDEHPAARILLKVHPEVVTGRKQGHFDLDRLARWGRVDVLACPVHPVRLLEQAAAVYTVTSQMGFEALLWGRPVRVFGLPFYAGWGLTVDALPSPARRQPVPLEQLAYAALAAYPRYRDPETGEACPAERVLSWLGLQRRQRERVAPRLQALGFSGWKRPLVRDFLQGSQVTFVRRPDRLAAGTPVAVWGRRAVADRGETPVLRLEDGFLRSVGLGVDLVRPLSWVLDASGLYYDATGPSDLETLLATTDFRPQLVERAARLRRRLVASGITKYNVGTGTWSRPAGRKRVVLVPGQVEADASIRWGADRIRTNADLLRTVRAAEPDAYIVYKPHPDVVAGMRRAGQGEAQAATWCDEVVTRLPIHVLLAAVDAVHVLTSLAGFEALLRGLEVHCHGRPFYAGWGLTRDDAPVPRRSRRLTLDELVAGALLLYPTYLHPTTRRYTTAEAALDVLLAGRNQAAPWWRGLRRLLLCPLKRLQDRQATGTR